MQTPENYVNDMISGKLQLSFIEAIAARDAEWQARVEKLEAALEQIGFNGLQAYCTDRCLCAARDMRILARAALESARGK